MTIEDWPEDERPRERLRHQMSAADLPEAKEEIFDEELEDNTDERG